MTIRSRVLAGTILLALHIVWSPAARAVDPPRWVDAAWVEERHAAVLRWLDAPGATGHIVLRRDSKSGDLQPVARVTLPSFADATVRSGATSWYAVQTVADAETSAPGEERTVAVPPPAGFKATSTTFTKFGKPLGKVGLAWTASPGAFFYNSYRSAAAPGSEYALLTQVVETEHVDTLVKTGEGYRYAIAAADFSGEPALSAEETVVVGAPPPRAKRPAQPQVVTLPTTLLWEAADRTSVTGEAKVQLPLGDAFDLAYSPEADLLYVSSTHLRQILVLRTSDGELLRRLGPRLGEHEVGVPLGVDVDRAGNLFVVDGLRGVVVVLTPAGAVQRVLTPLRGAGEPEPRLVDVAVLADGTACVTDNAAGRVIVFDRAGRELRRWQVPDTKPGLTAGITKISAAPDGNLVVLDGRTPRIHRYSPAGEPIASFGERRMGVDELTFTADVAPLAGGQLLVAETNPACIREFAFKGAEGVYQAHLSNARGDGGLLRRCQNPLALVSDGKDRIFLLDDFGNRIGAFRLGATLEPR